MILWIGLTTLIALGATAMIIPLVRRYDAHREHGGAVAVLTAQLSDLSAQERAGLIAAPEAEQLRTEIKRRMLAEDTAPRAAARPLSARWRAGLAIALVVLLAGGSTSLYAVLGTPQAAMPVPASAAAGAASAPAAHPAGDVAAMVRGLEQRLETAPDDPEGWRMLGWSYFQLERFQDAARAYGRARALASSEPGYASAQGEALVQAAGGVVTPDAKAAFEAARRLDASDARARYFLALFKDQAGDPQGAVTEWLELLAAAPADAPWAPQVRQTIEASARRAGIDLTGRLPEPSAGAATAGAAGERGPTAADVAAAAAMQPDDRMAMIRGMVDGLEARLKTNPGDAEGWVRLMRARMVLGEAAAAGRALQQARTGLRSSAAALRRIDEAARELGIPGA